MLGSAAPSFGIDPPDAVLSQIEPLDKDVNHANRIVLANPVFQAFRKQRALPAIRALNEAPHPTLPRIISRESHQKRRFHTGSVKPGLPPWGPHVRFRRVQTLVREGSPLVKLRNSA